MTIPELLERIAGSDDLPREWRVQSVSEWMLDGATMPEPQAGTTIAYMGERTKMFTELGKIETTRGLPDWIDRIILARDVPSAILFPFQAIVARAGVSIELAPDPTDEIPF